jgi:hypothetical protein
VDQGGGVALLSRRSSILEKQKFLGVAPPCLLHLLIRTRLGLVCDFFLERMPLGSRGQIGPVSCYVVLPKGMLYEVHWVLRYFCCRLATRL